MLLGYQISIALHLAGIIFWVGGLGARLLLLNSAKSDTSREARSQIYQFQRDLHFMMEIPGFVLALLPGMFLIHLTKVSFHQSWFMSKMVLVFGLIVIEFFAFRQFKAFNASGQAGQAVALRAGLVVFTLMILVAVKTRF